MSLPSRANHEKYAASEAHRRPSAKAIPVPANHWHTRAWALLAVLTLAALFYSATSRAQGYETISPAQNTSTEGKVEVLEFFWFGCPHCYAFEPSIEEWAKNIPSNTAFVREAPPLNPAWEQHSRAFYAAEILGIQEKFFPAMFEAIHKDKQRMRKPKDIAKLVDSLELDGDKFLATMKSFGVETRLRRSMQLAQGAGITGVPAVIVNGKYRINSTSAGSHEGMINAINSTVEIEKKSMGLE